MPSAISLLRGLSAVALLAGALAPGAARAYTFPDDADWIAVLQAGESIADVHGDGATNGREIVGDTTDAAISIANDGTNFFVRIRVDDDPTGPGGLNQYGWGLILDTDGEFTAYEYVLLTNGIAEQIEFAENTTPGTTGDPADTAETPVVGTPIAHDWTSDVNVRVVDADTTFDDDPDYFIDFGLPLSLLVKEGLDGVPLYFIGGCSSSGRSLSLDLAGCDGTTTDCTLADAASDPMDLDGNLYEGDCGDGIDNDEDGLTDCDDPDCTSGSTSSGDADGDGLSYCEEVELGTDPDVADTDGDGLLDGDEITEGTDPLDADTDDDDLPDGDEITEGTDPLDADTDDDDLSDGDEVLVHGTDPLDADSDDDGLSDSE